MQLSYKTFKKNLNKNLIFEKNPKIAVGVSGGSDSLALVILLNKWIKKRNGELYALIVDHGIRQESYYESRQIKKNLSSKKINCKILTVSRKKIKEGKQIQARLNRFEKLTNFCLKNKIFYLFLGHHFDDNIETFVIRKISGSNFQGLNAMEIINNVSNILILRPLLLYNKKNILLFNKKNNINFIKDPSNLNIKYTRVAIRNFLHLKSSKKNIVVKDFKLIKRHYYLYNKMIYQILNKITISVNYKSIELNANSFFSLDIEIMIKVFSICASFVNHLNYRLRIKKIQRLILQISKSQNISLKSNKIIINRMSGKLLFKRP